MYEDFKILVVGDLMLDEQWSSDEVILSPEAPVPALKNPTSRYSTGGAANVAHQVINFGAQCDIVGMRAYDFHGNSLTVLLTSTGIGTDGVSIMLDPYITTHKLRIMANGQQVARVDAEQYLELESLLLTTGYDAIIVADYDKGVLNKSTILQLMRFADEIGIPVFVDPKYKNFWEYKGATILKCNMKELDRAFPFTVQAELLANVSSGLSDAVSRLGLMAAVVTDGSRGIWYYSGGKVGREESCDVQVADATGAGDVVITALTLEYLRTGDIARSVWLANKAAGISVTKCGTDNVTLEELQEAIGGECSF